MTLPEVPRADLEQALLARARAGPPLLLAGPQGSGKTTLLGRIADALKRDGWVVVALDLMGAVSSPDRFVTAALDAMPASAFGRHLPEAVEIRRLAHSGRAHESEAVRRLLALWSRIDESAGRPVAFLFDEATEIRSLAYFKGLREADKLFGEALAVRRRGTILATSFATLARRIWPFEIAFVRPLAAADLASVLAGASLAVDAPTLVRACFGWPRYLRVLFERLATGGGDLVEIWADEMAAGGRIEAACRATYESLLLRSRGYGISKAALAAVALEEGLNLTALVARLGRTPGATRDYLQWLVGVDALRMTGKRYGYVDGMLRLWVRLHARGTPPTREELRAAAREATAGDGTLEPVLTPQPRRPESLIEID